ncbi:Bug family tripartite tricarboxylate transporter substrate binding protein [Ramlibacter rhizophilus]|uniref:Tripartite tricarboxylate transporter substrate binding protein n=1 Tax=Ramlibacter rhizophilus TaxID=1781167 RepID=A0A4Z0BS28_9BURK|nr:tripartite tricarboxylate transporter substrate-binding protein [Ramlibacter rhizophilus]TFZ01264.1 tripartite tricarboxylate transporter substrate binding protein [Ramlibacter rhizophilus]
MKQLNTLVAGLLAGTLALAQAPGAVGPLTVLVGGPPGTPGDTVARALSEPLAAELGRPVVVENRPGAAGTIAIAAVSRAPRDGSTLGVFALQAAAAPSLLKSVGYDTAALQPVRQLSQVSNVLVVRHDHPARTLAEVLEGARAGALTYASGGNGTPAHLAAELFRQRAGVALRHVPFNGPVAGLAALAGGHVDLMFATVPAALPLLRAGKVRALATTASQRLPQLPEVPTLAESGMAEASLRDWHGLVAPMGTPAAEVEHLAAAVGRALARPAVRERLVAAGLEPVADSGPVPFRRFVDAEMLRWSEVIRQAGITAQ